MSNALLLLCFMSFFRIVSYFTHKWWIERPILHLVNTFSPESRSWRSSLDFNEFVKKSVTTPLGSRLSLFILCLLIFKIFFRSFLFDLLSLTGSSGRTPLLMNMGTFLPIKAAQLFLIPVVQRTDLQHVACGISLTGRDWNVLEGRSELLKDLFFFFLLFKEKIF